MINKIRSLIFIFLIFIASACFQSENDTLPNPTYSWQTGTWGACTGNIQTRTVICKGSDGVLAAEDKCTKKKPVTSQSCVVKPKSNSLPNLTYSWQTGTWGACTGNIQTRTVICKGSDGVLAAEDKCTRKKPVETQSCSKDSAVTSSIVSQSVSKDSAVTSSIVSQSVSKDSAVTNSIVSQSVSKDSAVTNSIVSQSVSKDSAVTSSIVSQSFLKDSEITNSIEMMKFVLVEKGTFQMGSNKLYSDENPIHTVNITNDFYVGRYEVTNIEVVEVYNWAKTNNISNLTFSSTSVTYNGKELLDLDSRSCHITYNNGSLSVKRGKDNYPCVEITWYGANAFCKFLNQKEGVDNYRLLTEAEWEYVARGGIKSKGYRYSGSNTVDDVAWYSSNLSNTTHTVGTKSSNELGIYDMSGNVWEWVQDSYSSSYYSNSPSNNPLNSLGSTVVLRGGSWNSFFDFCRVANRYGCSPNRSHNNIGFRLAKSL